MRFYDSVPGTCGFLPFASGVSGSASWLPFLGIVALAIVGLVLVGCARTTSETSREVDGEGKATAPPNTLTEAERADGWQLLFDGEDLSEWRGYKRQDIPAGWQAKQGQLVFTPPEEGGGDLITKRAFDDFELRFDWKISEGGNSGVIYRVSEDRESTWNTGPEYQILDNEGHPDATNGSDRQAAANYALHAPTADADRPAGAWNQGRIVVRGNHVEHWLNGQQVVEYELGSSDWKERVENSKFSSMPGYGQNESGHIALQDHGQKVWYRNLKIKPLGTS